MAELLFRHYAPQLDVGSAGICALGGSPIDATAQAVLAAHGLDGRAHVARQLYGGLVDRAGLILTMDQGQLETVADFAPPRLNGCIFLLDRWRRGEDIPDPGGQPRSAFESIYHRIDAAVQAWLPHLAAGTRTTAL